MSEPELPSVPIENEANDVAIAAERSPESIVDTTWSDGSNCYGCHEAFTIIKRKHHCRNCGNVFCSICSAFSIEKTPGDRRRACASCFEVYQNPGLNTVVASDAETLMSLYVCLDGPNWKKCDGWADAAVEPKKKIGVTVNADDHINMIILTDNKLNGVLPDTLQNLTHLTKISLSKNYIRGSICKGLGRLEMLVCIQLSHNELTGRIPGFLGNLKLLQRLDLSHNLFYGSIPDELCLLTELRWLQLDNNRIEGQVPQGIGKLINLKTLSLNNNKVEDNKQTLTEILPSDCVILMDEKACQIS